MFKNVKMNELEKAIENQDAYIIDCREIYEYNEGHIPHAINAPTSDFANYMHLFDKSKHYYVICLTGARSLMVARYLDNQGYHVSNVLGGMIIYQGEIEENI